MLICHEIRTVKPRKKRFPERLKMKDLVNVGFIIVYKVHSGSHAKIQAFLFNQNKLQYLFKAALSDFQPLCTKTKNSTSCK